MFSTQSDILIALLSNAVLVFPLALFVTIVCRFIRRPAVAWCLWAMVLLKFVTPAWYPLPVEDFVQRLMPTPVQDVTLVEAVPDITSTSLLTQPAPALPSDSVEAEGPSDLLVQLARQSLNDLLVERPVDTVKQPIPLHHPVDLPPADMLLVEHEATIKHETSTGLDDSGGTPRPTGWAWRARSKMMSAPETSATPFLTSGRATLSLDAGVGTQSEPELPVSPAVASSDLWTTLPSGLILLCLWAAGCVALLCLAAVRVLRFQRLVRQAEPASPKLATRVREIAARLGCRRVPEVRVTSGRVPPVLWAVGWRPVILLPTDLLTQLDDEQQSALLTHELAHYARRDHWTRWFELSVRSLFWWHPIAWWAGHRLREAEEQCCDAWVVSLSPDAAAPYANALLTTIDFLNPPDHPVPALASGITPVRRSLRPFHRRLTMILEDRPSPILNWPSRLCLLAIAAIVLPLSLVAVADEPDQAATVESPATPATEVDASSNGDTDRATSRETDEQNLVFSLKNITVGDVIQGLNKHFADANVKPSVSVIESLTDEPAPVEQIKVTLTSDQLDDVRKVIAHLEEASTWSKVGKLPFGQMVVVYPIRGDAGSRLHQLTKHFFHDADNPPAIKLDQNNNHLIIRGTQDQHDDVTQIVKAVNEQANETITVVRAHYAMPEELAKAFETFINQHSPQFDVLIATTKSRTSVNRSRRQRADDDDDGLFSRSGIGSGSRSGLTIIATEDVQQQFGDFIRAITETKSTKDKDGNEPDTLTLVRETYDISVLPPQPQGLFADPSTPRPVPQLSPHAGLDVLLHSAKSTGQLSLLLTIVSANQLTVTTTPEFQASLGKFIAFLKERAPADEEQAVSRMSEAERKVRATLWLEKAREALKRGDRNGARQLAKEAQRYNADYDLFSDRPELLFKDLQDAPADEPSGGFSEFLGGNRRRSAGTIVRDISPAEPRESTLTREQQLASLQVTEQTIAAEIASIEKALESGANPTALSLMIGRKYADNAMTRKLVEMFSTAIDLEHEKRDLLRSAGPEFPEVVRVQSKIDAIRKSLGLPADEETQPLDLIRVHIESLKLQQQLLQETAKELHKTLDALKEDQAQSMPHGDAGASVAILARELFPLLVKEADLLKKHEPEHPEVVSIRRQIQMTRSFLQKQLGDDHADDSPLKLLQREVERLEGLIKELKAAHPAELSPPVDPGDE